MTVCMCIGVEYMLLGPNSKQHCPALSVCGTDIDRTRFLLPEWLFE